MTRPGWRNAQNGDRPEMGRAQSGFYDTKRGWVDSPRRDVSACEDIQPGSYRAIAGDTIEPGETGPILITTCDGTLVENAINQTDCTFYAGNRITANVDPCCVIHFTGCGGGVDPNTLTCCERRSFVCVNGITYPVDHNGGLWVGWITDCCDCLGYDPPEGFENSTPGSYLAITLECDGDVVLAHWQFYCVYTRPGAPIFGADGSSTSVLRGSGTLDWSNLCNETPAGYEDVVTVGGCDITIVASPALAANLCSPCSAQPPGCCDKTLWFCINNDSREMAVDGGDETWDVTECCPDCTSATVRLRMTCSNGIISLQRTYTCDGLVSNETTNISQYCSSTATTLLNIPTPNCFLQAQISIAEVACDSCDSCCDETRWYCINDQSKEMTLAGDSDTFDVADCCDCTTATLTLDVECIGQTNTLRYDWSLVCDGGAAITGFDFLACDASVLNIEAGDCFLQVAITTTDVGCAECGGETPTIIPPP